MPIAPLLVGEYFHLSHCASGYSLGFRISRQKPPQVGTMLLISISLACLRLGHNSPPPDDQAFYLAWDGSTLWKCAWIPHFGGFWIGRARRLRAGVSNDHLR